MKFEVTRVHPEDVLSTLPSEIEFTDEAMEIGVEFISQGQVLDTIRPYLKDPIGTQVVYSSTNTTGTPISKIEIINHLGELLVQLKRGENDD